MRKSFDPSRAAQLQIVLKPNWIHSYRPGGSSHGSPYEPDSHVPLLFWGPGYVGQGEVKARVEVADLAPTLAAIAGPTGAGPVAGPRPSTQALSRSSVADSPHFASVSLSPFRRSQRPAA